jgi:BrnA antitoxin of type II toxin-antitoxin system
MPMAKDVDFSKGRRGAIVPVATGKTRITIRLDDDLLAWFHAQVDAAGGGNYQTLINQTLRRSMTETTESLEAVVRRAIRAELGTTKRTATKRSRKVAA